MASELRGSYDEKCLENINRQLLENQSFLYGENQKLQDDVTRLSRQLELIRKSTVTPEIYESLRNEKDHLMSLNETLKGKIRRLRTPPTPMSVFDIEKENREKKDLLRTIHELDHILDQIKQSEKLKVEPPTENLGKIVHELTKKLEETQKKYEDANETIRKLHDDDEKYVLRERITDMKQVITDLEVENSKLKFESEQFSEDAENYKKELNTAVEEAKHTSKKCYRLEDEKDQLKESISALENEKIKLKKEMIEEMNEANRAKRVSVDTEIALGHVSEAYENKRREVMALQNQLDDAEKIIKGFRDQFEEMY